MKGRNEEMGADGVVLLGMRCGNDEVVVWLHLKERASGDDDAQMELTLDGKPATQQYGVPQGWGSCDHWRKEQVGQGRLSVNLYGLRADRCSSDGAIRAGNLMGWCGQTVCRGGRERAVTPAMCLVTVERWGTEQCHFRVPGVNCGTGCTMEVAGTKVTLTATTAAPFSGSLWEGCTAWNDNCEVTVTTAQRKWVCSGDQR